MKKTVLPLLAALFLCGCGENSEGKKDTVVSQDTLPKLAYFGDTITTDGATPAGDLEKQFNGKDSLAIKLTGKITDVCQKKGCWMEVDMGGGKTMRVTFKDYAFFVPKDAAGKTVTIDGYAYTDTVPVSQLRHYAEDAGKKKEEIEAIKEPEVTTSFEARGVIIRQ